MSDNQSSHLVLKLVILVGILRYLTKENCSGKRRNNQSKLFLFSLGDLCCGLLHVHDYFNLSLSCLVRIITFFFGDVRPQAPLTLSLTKPSGTLWPVVWWGSVGPWSYIKITFSSLIILNSTWPNNCRPFIDKPDRHFPVKYCLDY